MWSGKANKGSQKVWEKITAIIKHAKKLNGIPEIVKYKLRKSVSCFSLKIWKYIDSDKFTLIIYLFSLIFTSSIVSSEINCTDPQSHKQSRSGHLLNTFTELWTITSARFSMYNNLYDLFLDWRLFPQVEYKINKKSRGHIYFWFLAITPTPKTGLGM